MAIPSALDKNLELPVIVAPMFLVSGPELVLAACKCGVIGSLPALNHRTTEGYSDWLDTIKAGLGPNDAPYAVNLIVHKTNPRLAADLEVTIRHRVPLVITSLGAVRDVVDRIHGYGGLVFHDVINLDHARKAAAAGVDGLILVTAGAGGHAGDKNPFALLNEVRAFFNGAIILSGCLSTGTDVAAATMMQADFAYIGTRFINTKESLAPAEYKQMIIDSHAADITYTPAISGIPANFLNASLISCGFDPGNLLGRATVSVEKELGELGAQPWKQVWSAGQGVGAIKDVLPMSELISRMKSEFDEAVSHFIARFSCASQWE
ncbi:nitronate monooxygenase (plasmid) [Burkholderia sp. JSH-S8]|nr:nitronate monooxygenase [Burkholderia sp. JSH-S8]